MPRPMQTKTGEMYIPDGIYKDKKLMYLKYKDPLAYIEFVKNSKDEASRIRYKKFFFGVDDILYVYFEFPEYQDLISFKKELYDPFYEKYGKRK